ncbi:Crp/Fnr family transcriptional regulator [Dysgonomonas sp. 511]|uniref:Crp/Fnr family transcriptional regulator n=1 Tax=Dysgonomonas sp. 511 TaxID=2302930 RepID=UPI0013D1DB51|nr:Crp/Fnr family transcriptional regulator [Dysgonomonas sp. 511]NDV80241.1 Crp/Fnr family transcriptional regulator [Dysgonomonas sp. 511]
MANTNSVISLQDCIPEIWRLLSEKEQELISLKAEIREFKKNEIIYSEEEMPLHLMCLCKGKVKIYKDGVGGRSQIIRMIRPTQYFGYRAYFANQPYVTAAAAFESSTICFIPMQIIEEVVSENAQLGMFFIRELSTDLGIADERVVNLTQKHIRGRLAESLIFLIENYGLEEDGATISIYLSREDLANLSNMTTSNAIRTLSTFVDEHIITLDGRKIKIIDEERLRRISKIG